MMLPISYMVVSISYTRGSHPFYIDRSYTSKQQCSSNLRLARTFRGLLGAHHPSCVGNYVATSGFRLRLLEIGWIP